MTWYDARALAEYHLWLAMTTSAHPFEESRFKAARRYFMAIGLVVL